MVEKTVLITTQKQQLKKRPGFKLKAWPSIMVYFLKFKDLSYMLSSGESELKGMLTAALQQHRLFQYSV